MFRPTPSPHCADAAVVDLFCGVGGMSHGFRRRGFDVRAGFDFDGSCRHAYERNNGSVFVEADVATLAAADVAAHYPPGALRVLVGGPPCQAFSTYTQKRPVGDWTLLQAFTRIALDLQPDAIVVENVPGLARFRDGGLYRAFTTALVDAGYYVWKAVALAADYGVPQRRRRLLTLACKGASIRLLQPGVSATPTVRRAIGHLPPLAAGDASAADPFHRASAMSELNLERIRQSKVGGTWRDWPDDLVPACRTDRAGAKYDAVYGRMAWDEPAPTITTHCTGFGNGRFGHPDQDRALSLREAALLQSFPADYEFVPDGEPVPLTKAARWVGNAVPVLLAEAVADAVAASLGDSATEYESWRSFALC